MTVIEHGHAIADFQHLCAIGVMHRGRVCHIIEIVSAGNVHRHHIAHMVKVVVTERRVQRSEMCFAEVTEKVI